MKVPEIPLTRDCPACKHLAAGRLAERVSAVTGERAALFCLVRKQLAAVSFNAALARKRPIRACNLDHRPVSAGFETLWQLEALSGLPFTEGEDKCP